MIDKIPMTEAGHAAMMDEIKHLKSVERPRIIRAIEEARSHGDLSENAEYHAAKEQQGWTEARVAELEDKISRAEVIDISKLSGDTVKFGARVTLVDEDTEDKAVYRIVGEFEADVKKGLISVSSPIARAIIGKRKGDSVEVATPGGGKSYEIVQVAFN
jgi:transcription elongation factor GreA